MIDTRSTKQRGRHGHVARAAFGIASVALLAVACDSNRGPATSPRHDMPAVATTAFPAPTQRGSFIVEANVPLLAVYDVPGSPIPSRIFENPWYYDPARQYPVASVFYSDLREGEWIRILLPLRPNGSIGWVRVSDVRVLASRYRIEVDLARHHLVVYDGDQVLLEDTVAVGKPGTPTPTGQFYLRVLIKAPQPGTVYGPYAYGLSSHSEVLEQFNGDDAEIGIHGNNDPSVLGSDVSSGCIRMDNDKISYLANILPLGTPVDVR